VVNDFDKAIMANQQRMNADPFEAILMDMGYRIRAEPGMSGPRVGGSFNNDDSSPEEGAVQCRTS
jgi:WD and tetratricopeptide repeat-containing protein 1